MLKTFVIYSTKISFLWKWREPLSILLIPCKYTYFTSFVQFFIGFIKIITELFSVYVFSSAFDQKTGKKVAIKKLARPFQSAVHAKRTYRELRMLKHMNHENVSRYWIFIIKIWFNENNLSNFLSVSGHRIVRRISPFNVFGRLQSIVCKIYFLFFWNWWFKILIFFFSFFVDTLLHIWWVLI